MTAGIIGLGLIGGSFAKAYHEAGWTVLGRESDRSMLDFACMSGAVDGELTEENISQCDLILIAVYPAAAVEAVRQLAPYFGEKPIVIDCCGVKRSVCAECFPLAKQYGFTFLGGHPMSGSHQSGFKYARADLFRGAPMLLVPEDENDIALLGRARELLAPAQCGHISAATAQRHDEMIAFNSQLAHLVPNAYIKSPTALSQAGFSAGSYRDMTRVAWLNAPLWTELFLDNKDCLLSELDFLIDSLQQYKDAMERGDAETLCALLEEGKRRKEEVDGR